MRKRTDAGFSLLEVLVALVVLALFALASYRSLNAVLEAEVHSRGEMARWQKLASAYARIEADLQNAVQVAAAPGDNVASFAAELTDRGEAAFVLSRLVADDADAGVRRVGYRFASRQFTRSSGSDIYRESAAPPVALLDGLDQASIRYMNAAGKWQPTWAAAGELPRAVEVVFAWPDGVTLRRVFNVQ